MRWGRYQAEEELAASRRRAAENLRRVHSGEYEREALAARRQHEAERIERARRRERRKEIAAQIKQLRVELKEQQKLYRLIERDKADTRIWDAAAHKQDALEAAQARIESLTAQINKLLDERNSL